MLKHIIYIPTFPPQKKNMLHKLGYKSINQNEHLYILLTFLTFPFPNPSNLRGPCAPRASVYEVPPRFALANAPQQPAGVNPRATRFL